MTTLPLPHAMLTAAAAIALLLAAPGEAAAQRVDTGFVDRHVTLNGVAYRYQVYVPTAYGATAERWPVILFLHGAGERGADGLLQTSVGLPGAIRSGASRYPAIVVMPQAPRDSVWLGAPADAALLALDRTLAEFRTDPDRVYLTGLSMGGNGVWHLAYRFAERFAAVAPVCAFITPLRGLTASRPVVPADSGDAFAAVARRLKDVPTWIFHGEVDPVVPVSESRRAAAALTAVGGNVRYTEYPGMSHDVWNAAYGSPQFVEWLFAQKRGRAEHDDE